MRTSLHPTPGRLLLVCVFTVFATALLGQQPKDASSSQAGIPRLIKFNGALRDLSGKPISGPVDVTFSLYTDESGGNALWFETQTVQADALGHYTVLLGAMTPTGVPMELFTSGEAHWLGVQTSNLPEQQRVLLVSVPYAMKAGDAETLGGKPASAYVLSSQTATDLTTSTTSTSLTNLITSGATKTTTNSAESPVTNAITASSIPVFTDGSGTLANSIMTQSGAKLGINTATPAFSLDLNGNVFMVGTKTPVPGAGGTMRFRDDAGIQRWLFGMPGSAGSQDFQMYNYTNGHAPLFIQNGAASYSLYLAGSGNVGIGTASPASKLDVNGAVHASGNIATSGIFNGNGSMLNNVTASSLACSGCVGNTQLGVNYAASSSKGGAASNALALNGVAASGYATLLSNAFVGDQAITGNLSVSADQTINGNLILNGTVNGWIITPFTSSSCTVFSSNYTTCVSGNVLGGYTGLGGKSIRSSALKSRMVMGKKVLASVSGGNTIVSGVIGGTVSGGGGTLDGASYANTVTNNWATVAGGALNIAGDNLAPDDPNANCCQAVGGGLVNTADGFAATVAGGGFSSADGNISTVAGGAFNIASGFGSTVGGGGGYDPNNQVSLGNYSTGTLSTISGGQFNTADGDFSTIPGGYGNETLAMTSDTFAAGCKAFAENDGSFIWAGHTVQDTNCTKISTATDGQFVANAPGGFWLGGTTTNDTIATQPSGHFLETTTGAYLSTSGTWTNNSDRNLKTAFEPIDQSSLLASIGSLPITRWRYKVDPESITHVGPMAQDFYAAFKLGNDNKHISTVDEGGVALAAIQALYKMVQKKDEQIQALGQQMEEMRAEIEQLKKSANSK